MPIPKNLVFVRHGESEGNAAMRSSKKGDNSRFTPSFRGRHDALRELTPEGCTQSVAAGKWIREHFPNGFSRYYVSDYLRALQTAQHLDLPDATWFISVYLGERDYGDISRMTHSEQQAYFKKYPERIPIHPILSAMPNGYSLKFQMLFIEKFLDTMHRECAEQDVIVVCHGEVMWTFRYVLERMLPSEFIRLDQSKNPHDRIHNAQILHYTRIDPENGKLSKYPGWMRSICPWNTGFSPKGWIPIRRNRLTNDALAKEMERLKQFAGR